MVGKWDTSFAPHSDVSCWSWDRIYEAGDLTDGERQIFGIGRGATRVLCKRLVVALSWEAWWDDMGEKLTWSLYNPWSGRKIYVFDLVWIIADVVVIVQVPPRFKICEMEISDDKRLGTIRTFERPMIEPEQFEWSMPLAVWILTGVIVWIFVINGRTARGTMCWLAPRSAVNDKIVDGEGTWRFEDGTEETNSAMFANASLISMASWLESSGYICSGGYDSGGYICKLICVWNIWLDRLTSLFIIAIIIIIIGEGVIIIAIVGWIIVQS